MTSSDTIFKVSSKLISKVPRHILTMQSHRVSIPDVKSLTSKLLQTSKLSNSTMLHTNFHTDLMGQVTVKMQIHSRYCIKWSIEIIHRRWIWNKWISYLVSCHPARYLITWIQIFRALEHFWFQSPQVVTIKPVYT